MGLSRIYMLFGLLLGVMVACTPSRPVTQEVAGLEATPTPPPQVEEQVPTATAKATKTISATEEPITPTPTVLPTLAPTSTPAEIAETNEPGCLSCHGDKERLIETAAPEEEKPPSESSGVG